MTLFLPSRRALLPGLALAVVAWLPAAPRALEAGPPSAKLDFKLPKTTTLGEPAIMTAQLYNTTGYRIVADFGVNDQTEFGSVQIDGGDPAGLKRTAQLPIEVKPRDPARLEKRGAEWLKQVSTLSPGSEALERLARSPDPDVRGLAQRALAGR